MGPRWGLQSPQYQSCNVIIYRPTYFKACQGYKFWTTLGCYSCQYWFKDGLRGSHGVPFTGGWYRWTVTGTWDDIMFTLYDVDYIEDGDTAVTHGDVSADFNAASNGGAWAAIFGYGWQAFTLCGDLQTGIEDISVDILSGTGVFNELGREAAVTAPFERGTWGGMKNMFR